jgi:hypothetical protein
MGLAGSVGSPSIGGKHDPQPIMIKSITTELNTLMCYRTLYRGMEGPFTNRDWFTVEEVGPQLLLCSSFIFGSNLESI